MRRTNSGRIIESQSGRGSCPTEYLHRLLTDRVVSGPTQVEEATVARAARGATVVVATAVARAARGTILDIEKTVARTDPEATIVGEEHLHEARPESAQAMNAPANRRAGEPLHPRLCFVWGRFFQILTHFQASTTSA